jgi:demethylmenaquinone methyltransferase/2-methoxy-6-polyprenyl-1,4-benzoquinol methylase
VRLSAPPRTDLTEYYAARAREYEKIYLKPERQDDLRWLKTRLCELLADHHVLEVACGTGYWTAVIAEATAKILATDINPQVLTLAKAKQLPPEKVNFLQDDAFSLQHVHGHFTAGFAGFWWSHLRKSELKRFLTVFHAKLAAGALVIFIDNLYVEGSSTAIARQDEEGNTYQLRRLESSATYEVLKNFPEESELKSLLAEFSEHVHVERRKYYWLMWYHLLQQ